jgi:hypothetical protein
MAARAGPKLPRAEALLPAAGVVGHVLHAGHGGVPGVPAGLGAGTPYLLHGRGPGVGHQVQDKLDGEALGPVAVKPTVAVAPGAREPSYEALLTVTVLPDWV